MHTHTHTHTHKLIAIQEYRESLLTLAVVCSVQWLCVTLYSVTAQWTFRLSLPRSSQWISRVLPRPWILTATLEAADISSLELQTFAACCLMLIAGRRRDAAQNVEGGVAFDWLSLDGECHSRHCHRVSNEDLQKGWFIAAVSVPTVPYPI